MPDQQHVRALDDLLASEPPRQALPYSSLDFKVELERMGEERGHKTAIGVGVAVVVLILLVLIVVLNVPGQLVAVLFPTSA